MRPLPLLHKGAGLLAGAFLVFQGLTGALLLYRDDIERAARPQIPARVEANGRAPLPLQEVLDRLAPAQPLFVNLPPRDAAPLEIVLLRGAKTEFIAVDPYTGASLGLLRGDGAGWLRPYTRYHFNFLPGTLALFTLFLVLSGMLLRRWRSPHARLGLALSLPLTLYALSAVLIVWFRPAPIAPATAEAGPRAAADRYLASALAAVPDARVSYLSFSPKSVSVRLKAPGDPRRTGNTDVWLNPSTAAVLRVDRLASQPLRTQAYHWLAAFHLGELGPRPLSVLLGFTPLVLLLSALRELRRNRAAR